MESSTVSVSDVKPLLGRLWSSRTKLEWALIALSLVLAILAIVFIAGYAHCRGQVGDLKEDVTAVREDLKEAVTEAEQVVEPKLDDGHCRDLSGRWHNTLGSEMILNITKGEKGFLFGEYGTQVETNPGAAGPTSHSIIVGAKPNEKPGSVFAFSVMWSGGNSITTWTAQCMSCDGEEKLVASYMVRAKQGKCGDEWKSTLVGQDVFSRTEVGDETPYTPSQELVEVMKWKPADDLDKLLGKTPSGPCSLDGEWFSDNKDKEGGTPNYLSLTHEHGFIMEGRYYTVKEHRQGIVLEIQHSLAYGIANSAAQNTTMALFVTYDGGREVTGWTGQCHVCGSGEDRADSLETTWLHRKQVETCQDNWKSSFFGRNSYKRVQ